MLMIRLSRRGRKNLAMYALVVQEKTAPIKGKYIEIVGSYNPHSKENKIQFDADKVGAYIKNGAQPTPTVARIFKKNGVSDMDKFIPRYTMKKKAEAAAA